MKKSLKRYMLTVLSLSFVLITFCQSAYAESNNNRNAERAIEAYKILQTYFYQPDTKLYLEHYPYSGGNKYSYVWPFAAALQATDALAQIPKVGDSYRNDVKDRLDGLEKYWNNSTNPPGYDSYVRPPLGGGGDKFYDDNEWLGLEFIKIYRKTGDQKVLDRAKQIFDLTVYGWDNDSTHPCSGGVYWTQAPWSRDRNTVSNAPAAELGLNLFEITKDARYLDWSKKMYDWVNGCLLAPNGLYWDHINLKGEINKTIWSYNQGTMLGASVLLYKATKDQVYLNRAEGIANAALEYYGASRLYTQPIVFNSILFDNLLMLDSVKHNPKYRKYIQSYIDEIWETIRDKQTGLVQLDANKSPELLEQASLVTIYANLAASESGKNEE